MYMSDSRFRAGKGHGIGRGRTGAEPAQGEEEQDMADKTTIKAPVPGTFYRRPSPDEDPYIDEGDRVSDGQVIGLVEVMKNFNEVKAHRDGVLESFLVENEDLVEAGQDIAALAAE
jgi:acetyl-CoA carboxylase biotin carboxyl carrier protein